MIAGKGVTHTFQDSPACDLFPGGPRPSLTPSLSAAAASLRITLPISHSLQSKLFSSVLMNRQPPHLSRFISSSTFSACENFTCTQPLWWGLPGLRGHLETGVERYRNLHAPQVIYRTSGLGPPFINSRVLTRTTFFFGKLLCRIIL